MMEKLVCNRQSRNCMLKRCDDCPKTNEPLRQYLEDILEDFDDEEEFKFSQWISDGHMKLQTMLLPRQEFIGFCESVRQENVQVAKGLSSDENKHLSNT
ncbi:hypothetical protein J6590_066509 [Homalodisca vitripennis]|nr:hypothetical protein J6590_066509 [Homalodisca vitripennis]